MIVKNGNTPDASTTSLERALESREASKQVSSQQATQAANNPAPLDDKIALSAATNWVQQTLSAGQDARLQRILELKTEIQHQQYVVDPAAVSHAIINAALHGH